MVRQNILLARYTTFKIGGPVKYFIEAGTSQDLLRAVGFAQDRNLPYFILGGGSNILVSDQGFDGVAIRNKCRGIVRREKTFVIQSGELTQRVAQQVGQAGYTGMEWAVGLPGTMGGAMQTQAACFGGSICKIIKSIEKRHGIILSMELKLKKDKLGDIEKRMKTIVQERNSKQPIGMMSAGCFFKNPLNQSAGQLIDQAGLKGKRVGQAMVSDLHANYIVNLGQATARDVCRLANHIKETILEIYGIMLEQEVNYVGIK